MYAILGATGNVGFATATTLRNAGHPVRAIVRDAGKASALIDLGCEIAVADLQDPDALSLTFRDAQAVQVILPLNPVAKDPVADMHRSQTSIIEALDKARVERVLAISDLGAHVDHDIGMPSVFRAFETALRARHARTSILRTAEHMHNWGQSISAALASGVLPSFQQPIDMVQPTIAASDLGVIAADDLLSASWNEASHVVHAEGPKRYSAAHVAAALSDLSGRAIRAEAVPRSQWDDMLGQSLPRELVALLMKTNDAKNAGGLVDVEPGKADVRYGTTELIEGLRPLVLRAMGSNSEKMRRDGDDNDI